MGLCDSIKTVDVVALCNSQSVALDVRSAFSLSDKLTYKSLLDSG